MITFAIGEHCYYEIVIMKFVVCVIGKNCCKIMSRKTNNNYSSLLEFKCCAF